MKSILENTAKIVSLFHMVSSMKVICLGLGLLLAVLENLKLLSRSQSFTIWIILIALTTIVKFVSMINSMQKPKLIYSLEVCQPDRSVEQVCSICRDKIQTKDKVLKLNCLHWFHAHCLVEWLKLKRNCPLCKSEISLN